MGGEKEERGEHKDTPHCSPVNIFVQRLVENNTSVQAEPLENFTQKQHHNEEHRSHLKTSILWCQSRVTVVIDGQSWAILKTKNNR